jgi:hypothetical protein
MSEDYTNADDRRRGEFEKWSASAESPTLLDAWEAAWQHGDAPKALGSTGPVLCPHCQAELMLGCTWFYPCSIIPACPSCERTVKIYFDRAILVEPSFIQAEEKHHAISKAS